MQNLHLDGKSCGTEHCDSFNIIIVHMDTSKKKKILEEINVMRFVYFINSNYSFSNHKNICIRYRENGQENIINADVK